MSSCGGIFDFKYEKGNCRNSGISKLSLPFFPSLFILARVLRTLQICQLLPELDSVLSFLKYYLLSSLAALWRKGKRKAEPCNYFQSPTQSSSSQLRIAHFLLLSFPSHSLGRETISHSLPKGWKFFTWVVLGKQSVESFGHIISSNAIKSH